MSILFGAATGLIEGLRDGFNYSAANGILGGLIAGMAAGGLFCLRHAIVRVMLWSTRSTPLRYVRFLDSAVEHIFLYRAGAGYRFMHGMLREYFTSLGTGAN